MYMPWFIWLNLEIKRYVIHETYNIAYNKPNIIYLLDNKNIPMKRQDLEAIDIIKLFL